VPAQPDPDTAYEITCPHCGGQFVAEPMVGSAQRYQGFKCPHCRLFVPFERAEDRDRVDRVDEPLQG
jgi:DNA-directed RNA polymerase subunit RPC12/RpoP